ncbi:MAG: hypothetical protein ACRD3P_12635 [Terriglobales bacterium]
MDPKIVREILEDLIPSLETLEAKSTAALEFLKHEGIASDEKLAPYLEQAASASNVRWLGVRVRIERLLFAAEKDSAQKRTDKGEKKPDGAKTKAVEGRQSQPEAGDNSKTMSKDSEPKSNIDANDAARKDEKGDRLQINGKPAATGGKQKVA